jgi:hypothetical protein
MRMASGVLFVFLLVFAAVQVNDPDPLFWGAVYGVGAAWSGIAAFRPAALARPRLAWALAATVALAVAAVVWFWPQAETWWLREVWWEDEAAREGMGLMIVLAALVLAGLQALRARGRSA